MPPKKPRGKTPRNSAVETVEHIKPGDTNAHGTMFGGKVLQWIDIVAAVAAMRHSRMQCVTASFDRVDFVGPAYLGEILNLRAKLTYTGRTSMEVAVDVMAENPLTGDQRLTTHALVTFVAVDSSGKPMEVPPLIPETADEKMAFQEGEKRREMRAKMRKENLRQARRADRRL